MDFVRPNLTLVIDRRLYRPQQDSEPLSLVEAAINGGVTMVQLRLPGDNGNSSAAEDLAAYAIAQRLRELTSGRVPFLITGDLKLADRCHADGVLLVGERSYKPSAARDYLGGTNAKFVGCFVDSVQGASRAENNGADFVQVGPVFDPLAEGQEDSLATIRKVKDAVNVPLVAFGGVDSPEKAAAAIEAGADGIAVTEAILSAPDPREAAMALCAAIGAAESK